MGGRGWGFTWLHLAQRSKARAGGTTATGGSSATKRELAGPLAPVGAARRTTRKPRKTMSNQIRTHQECPELIQEAPQMPHDLAEPLFKPFRQHSFTKSSTNPKGTVSPSPGALMQLQSPGHRITDAGAIRISLFWTHPPTSDIYTRWVGVLGSLSRPCLLAQVTLER